MTGRRACGHIEGPPTTNGLYAAEVYFGWKILEWYESEWWHTDLVGRWTASIPVQWVGPLPLRMKDRKMDFDL